MMVIGVRGLTLVTSEMNLVFEVVKKMGREWSVACTLKHCMGGLQRATIVGPQRRPLVRLLRKHTEVEMCLALPLMDESDGQMRCLSALAVL